MTVLWGDAENTKRAKSSQALGMANGEGRRSPGVGEGSRRTAGPSAPLRSGRDDKGEGTGSIKSSYRTEAFLEANLYKTEVPSPFDRLRAGSAGLIRKWSFHTPSEAFINSEPVPHG
jgi:hypothetical protein